MKFFKSLRQRMNVNILKNKRGQGATEYILLLVVLVGVVMLFKGKIMSTIEGKMTALDKNIQDVAP